MCHSSPPRHLQDPGARVRANSVWDGGCAMSPRWRLVGEGLKVEEAPEPSGDGSLEEFAHREKAVADLFYLWDLDHDYVVDPKEMAMVWWATNIFFCWFCCYVVSFHC